MTQSTELIQKIQDRKATISVIGLGYVGLPTAVFFADEGFRVIGADLDEAKVQAINSGRSPLHELELDTQLADVVTQGRLSATTDIVQAVRQSDICLIIVPTPVTEAKEPDLRYVQAASRDVRDGLHPGMLIVLESTTYPGTTEEIVQPILEESGLVAGVDFGLAYCPERYNPGDAAHPIRQVARVVGGITPEWTEAAVQLYASIIDAGVHPVSSLRTAEAAKIIENIQRDLNIALMNELALIFERMDIDVMEVIRAASTKWNFNVYYPGPGVGGHCLPVDPYYLTKKAQELGYHAQVILAGRRVNDAMPFHILDLLIDGLNEAGKPLKGSRILVLGASYKANTADLRESPSEMLIHEAVARGAHVSVADPYCDTGDVFGCPVVSIETNKPAGYDAIVYMVDHDAFKVQLDGIVQEMVPGAVFVDGRRGVDPVMVESSGLTYRGVGYSQRS